jgi:hypothetical protein
VGVRPDEGPQLALRHREQIAEVDARRRLQSLFRAHGLELGLQANDPGRQSFDLRLDWAGETTRSTAERIAASVQLKCSNKECNDAPLVVCPPRDWTEARAGGDRSQDRTGTQKPAGPPLLQDYIAFTVTAPTPALALDPFYKKFVDAHGIPVVTAANVPDAALLVARDIVQFMLANRPDLRKELIRKKWKVAIMAQSEVTYAPNTGSSACCRRSTMNG